MATIKGTDTGKQAEDMAARFLKKQGLTIVSQNYLIKGGEIDIIARDKDTLVFVEVKFRQAIRFGLPAETIDHRKQQRIIKAASYYLQQHSLWDKIACRFDTICMTSDNTCQSGFKLDWQKNAFTTD